MKKYITPALRVIEIKADSSLLSGSQIKAVGDTGAVANQDNLSVYEEAFEGDWDEADED